VFGNGGGRIGIPGRAGTLAAAIAVLAAAPAAGREAYVVNAEDDDVSVIDTATNANLGSDIPVGGSPVATAITPDGARAYVVNLGDDDVSVIDIASNTRVGADIAVGDGPSAVAITPDGARAYVVNNADDDVSVIDTATNTKLPTDIAVGTGPRAVAITPNGARAYVSNFGDDDVSVIDTATNTKLPTDIAVGNGPGAIAITPDGARAYVANVMDDDVSVIDTATNTKLPADIAVGEDPRAVAITPDGARAYVANEDDDDVSVIEVASNTNLGADIAVGDVPGAIAITPDGARAYVANIEDDDVSVIDIASNTNLGADIAVGDGPRGIAIRPDEPAPPPDELVGLRLNLASTVKANKLKVTVTCIGADCEASLRGKVRVKGSRGKLRAGAVAAARPIETRSKTVRLAADEKMKVKLKLRRRGRAALKRALRKGDRVKGTVSANATDAIGNVETAKALVRLQAAGADVDPSRAAVVVDPDLLQVRVEAPPGGDHRVAARVAERGALAAAEADLGHRTRDGSARAPIQIWLRSAAMRRTAIAALRPWSRRSPPARASACSRVSQVITPNEHGTPVASATS